MERIGEFLVWIENPKYVAWHSNIDQVLNKPPFSAFASNTPAIVRLVHMMQNMDFPIISKSWSSFSSWRISACIYFIFVMPNFCVHLSAYAKLHEGSNL